MRILDQQGLIFFSNKQDEEGDRSELPSDLGIISQVQAETPLTRVRNTNIGPVYDISMLMTTTQEAYIFRAGFFLDTDVRLNTGIFLTLFVFLGVLMIAFVWIVGRLLIKPVEDLTTEAKQITRGAKLDFLSTRFRDDEIGDLARSLHLLLKELEAKRKLLAEQEKLALLGKGTGRSWQQRLRRSGHRRHQKSKMDSGLPARYAGECGYFGAGDFSVKIEYRCLKQQLYTLPRSTPQTCV